MKTTESSTRAKRGLKPDPITLKMLRGAAPKEWKLHEESPLYRNPHKLRRSWAFSAYNAEQHLEILVFDEDRQTARRAALAALRAMGGENIP